ncbi:MAG: nickel ABC transporter permease [Nitriliruptorales bacterium]
MGRYVVRRLVAAVPTLLGLSLLIFILVTLAPGDPAEELARRRAPGGEVTQEEIERTRHELGLDRPFVVQYGQWLKGALRGDLGESFSRQTPVWDEIRGRFGASTELALAALLMVVGVALPLGVVSAMLRHHWADHLSRFVALAGAAIPDFFLAYVLIAVFATRLSLFPVAGRRGMASLVLPAAAIAVAQAAIVARFLRSSLLEVLSEAYIRAARSKGLGNVRVVVRHGLRNAAIPVVTVLGPIIGAFLDGVIITEVIFAWPGIGRLTFEAIVQRDYPVIQGVVMFAGAIYITLNLLVDLSYSLLDPRVRLELSS